MKTRLTFHIHIWRFYPFDKAVNMTKVTHHYIAAWYWIIYTKLHGCHCEVWRVN